MYFPNNILCISVKEYYIFQSTKISTENHTDYVISHRMDLLCGYSVLSLFSEIHNICFSEIHNMCFTEIHSMLFDNT